MNSNGASTHMQQPQQYMNNNYPMNNLVNAALNPNQNQNQQGQPQASRKRKRGNTAMIVDDELEDPDAEWIPPSKKQKLDGSQIIDLANDDIDDNEVVRCKSLSIKQQE